ncbi:MAG: glycosyltransferase family 4 protein [Clostridia bacterium]
MIKVCHMTSAHKSTDVRIFKKQCLSLDKAGYDTYLVAKGESRKENGVHVVGVGEILGGRVKRMTLTTKIIYKKALELDCDIYQIHDPELLPYALKLKKKGKKVIFDSHEDYVMLMCEKYYIPKIMRHLVAKTFDIYQSYVLKKIDGVIFPCLKDGRHIFEGKCKNIATVGNEVSLNELYEAFDKNLIKDGNTICHIGSLTYNRGIKHLILANGQAKSSLILGGEFAPESFKQELELLDGWKEVDYRGFCNRAQVLDIYKHSKIGICTILNVGQYNAYDNFATKVYEYMSMGMPVIMSDYSFARKVNDKYNFAILVKPDDINAIANAINYLIDNSEIAYEMGQNGRRAIKEEYNWDNEAQKLFKLYEEISK